MEAMTIHQCQGRKEEMKKMKEMSEMNKKQWR